MTSMGTILGLLVTQHVCQRKDCCKGCCSQTAMFIMIDLAEGLMPGQPMTKSNYFAEMIVLLMQRVTCLEKTGVLGCMHHHCSNCTCPAAGMVNVTKWYHWMERSSNYSGMHMPLQTICLQLRMWDNCHWMDRNTRCHAYVGDAVFRCNCSLLHCKYQLMSDRYYSMIGNHTMLPCSCA